MFDIASLSIKESTTLHLLHPATGEKLYADEVGKKPVTITIASTSSKEYRTAVNTMHNRQLKHEQKYGKKKPMTAEQRREEGIDLLVACCLSAENLPYKGKEIKTEADFKELLSDDGMSWIKEQIDEVIGSVDLFIQ